MSLLRTALLVLPGLAVASAVAAVSRWSHGTLPHELAAGLGEAVLAVAIGLFARRVLPWRKSFDPGVRFAFHTVLRTAIVLLGLRFSLSDVGAIGAHALSIVLVLMTVALAVAHGLGRGLGIDPRLATLIGVGTAVCGNSAISATAPVIGARDEELSYAVAVNTLFGTFAVFVYPLLGDFMHMSAAAFGTWVGTAVNDTSQVVATGFSRGEVAGEVATAVKLTRNALMGVVILIAGWIHSSTGQPRSAVERWRASLPPFVLGFLALALANTLGWVEAVGNVIGRDLARDGADVAKLLVLVALAGVGLGTRLRSLREIGPRPLLVGLATATTTAVLGLVLVSWFGAASR